MRNSQQAGWALIDLAFAIGIFAFSLGIGCVVGALMQWMINPFWGGIGVLVGFVLGMILFVKLVRAISRRLEQKRQGGSPTRRDKN